MVTLSIVIYCFFGSAFLKFVFWFRFFKSGQLLKNLDKRLPEVFHFLEQIPTGCSYYHETIGWLDENYILIYRTVLPPRNIGEESLHRDFYKSSLKLAEHLKIVNLDYGYVLLNNEQTELLENILFGRKNSIIT